MILWRRLRLLQLRQLLLQLLLMIQQPQHHLPPQQALLPHIRHVRR